MITHLDSGPTNPLPLCGASGITTNEITEVDCPRCVNLHDEITEAHR